MVVNGTNAAGNTGTGSTGGTGSAAGAGSNSPSGAGAANSATTLGGTNFLTLMLAQLKNQDPTSPVDSNTFLTQLAQLSEVQGITQLNTSFSTLSSALSPSQALQASSLLGHKVLAASATANAKYRIIRINLKCPHRRIGRLHAPDSNSHYTFYVVFGGKPER